MDMELLAIALYESRARSLAFIGTHKRAWLDMEPSEREDWRQHAIILYRELNS